LVNALLSRHVILPCAAGLQVPNYLCVLLGVETGAFAAAAAGMLTYPLKVAEQLHHARRPVTLQASKGLINAWGLLQAAQNNTAAQAMQGRGVMSSEC
jgi:hypothetical protein